MKLTRIKEAMANNGYQPNFIEKAIQKQIKRSVVKRKGEQEEDMRTVTTCILFIDGLSQEIRRIARTADVRCIFSTPSTLRDLYNAKDRLDSDCQTHAVYLVKCKTCRKE